VSVTAHVTAHVASMYVGRGATLYDEIASGDTCEIRELLHEVRGTRGRVLELAAGSGRLTFPLLPFCTELVAVDLSADLLAILSGRAASLPSAQRERLHVLEADVRDLPDLGRFDRVVLGTTSISLFAPDERASLYADVAGRLTPGGRFVLSLRVAPDGGSDERVHELDAGLRLEERVLADGVLVAGLREAHDPDRVHEVRTYPITRDELLDELARAGFRLVSDVAVGGVAADAGVGAYWLFSVVHGGAS